MSDNPNSPLPFEQAMEQLEDCVSRLESGQLTLEEALEVFERGVTTSKNCAQMLNQFRKRVQVLVEKAEGEFQLDFLDPPDENDLEKE